MKDKLTASSNETTVTMLNNNKKQQQQQMNISRDDQKQKATELMNKELKLGQKWYLINSDWFTRWANFVNFNNDNDYTSNFLSPDKINNKTLLNITEQQGYHLKKELTEEIDYYTVCEELWTYLVHIYSINSSEV